MKLLPASVLLFTVVAQAQWQKIPVPTQAGFRGLSVVSQKVVWASGTDGTVIRTIDGGKNWSVMTVAGAEKLDFRGIKAFDNKTAVIISSGPAERGQARIYRTADGGKNWKQGFEEKRAGIFFDAVAFWDRKHGIVLSDPVEGKFVLFTTDDGGVTWKQLPPPALPAALPNEGAFAASNSCLTVQGTGNVWFATGGAKVARVFRSNDRGKTWQVAETPMHPANASSGIFSLAFEDANRGIAVGGDYAHPESSDLPNVMFTGDGGRSWQVGPTTNPAGMYLSSVAGAYRVGDRHAPGGGGYVAVGTHGALESLDGFKSRSDENLNSVAVAEVSRKSAWIENVWAVGPKGRVARTSIKFARRPFSISSEN